MHFSQKLQNSNQTQLIKPMIIFLLALIFLDPKLPFIEAKTCKKRCNLALASYYIVTGSNLTYISTLFGKNSSEILPFNPHVKSKDQIINGTRLNIPFSCDCLKRGVLGHTFSYTTQVGDTYDKIAESVFAKLTTVEDLESENGYDPNRIPALVSINVNVNCTCGDPHVSDKYGLFLTYPIRPGDNLTRIVKDYEVSPDVLQEYNPGVDFGSGSGLAFVPAKDQNGTFPPLGSIKSEFSKKLVVIVIIVAVASATLLFVIGLYICIRRRSDETEAPMLQLVTKADSNSQEHGYSSVNIDTSELEFSYEELKEATDKFCSSKMIGQGGFGSVYYGELRGQKVAIKKMRTGGSKSFLAELKVLTNVQHKNLVRLIGYCINRSLFLVYEFIENGSLDQHLRGSGKDPLPWVTRVQIAIDSASALEYIHEHTVPLYIHRDIKSANILIDRSFRAKVADFGLAKLTGMEIEEAHTSNVMGTFGYMPTEYVETGALSQKIDVFAFGVVLYELISAKSALSVFKRVDGTTDYTRLVDMFDEVLGDPDHDLDDLRKLVDPRLGNDYPLDSVHSMAMLARACTQETSDLRPSMRTVVVLLSALSSTSTEKWDIGLCLDGQLLC